MFSIKDYMSGMPLPDQTTVNDNKQIKHYGIALSSKGKPYTFVTYDPNKIYGNIILHESSFDDTDVIKNKLSEMMQSFVATKPSAAASSGPTTGDYINYCDSQGTHTGIMLEYGVDESWLLLITSNRFWNPLCREMTKDEISLINHNGKALKSYLAPVWRPSRYITVMASGVYSHRVGDMIREFSNSKNACHAY